MSGRVFLLLLWIVQGGEAVRLNKIKKQFTRASSHNNGLLTAHGPAEVVSFVRHPQPHAAHSGFELRGKLATNSTYVGAGTHQVPAESKRLLTSAMLPDSMLETNRSFAAVVMRDGIVDGIAKLANMTGVAAFHLSMGKRVVGFLVALLLCCVVSCAACECMLRWREDQITRFGLRRRPMAKTNHRSSLITALDSITNRETTRSRK